MRSGERERINWTGLVSTDYPQMRPSPFYRPPPPCSQLRHREWLAGDGDGSGAGIGTGVRGDAVIQLPVAGAAAAGGDGEPGVAARGYPPAAGVGHHADGARCRGGAGITAVAEKVKLQLPSSVRLARARPPVSRQKRLCHLQSTFWRVAALARRCCLPCFAGARTSGRGRGAADPRHSDGREAMFANPYVQYNT